MNLPAQIEQTGQVNILTAENPVMDGSFLWIYLGQISHIYYRNLGTFRYEVSRKRFFFQEYAPLFLWTEEFD